MRQLDVDVARPIAEQALQAATTQEVTDLLTDGLRKVADLEGLHGGWLPDP